MVKFACTVISLAVVIGILNGSIIITAWGAMLFCILWAFTIFLYTPVSQAWNKKQHGHYKNSFSNSNLTANKNSSSSLSWNILTEAFGKAMLENNSSSKIYVKTHRRRDGTQVRGHYRRKHK